MKVSKKFLKEYYDTQGEDGHHQRLQYASERYLHTRIVRKALVEFLLDKFITSEELSSFLDVGCSEGWYVDYTVKNTTLSVGIDIGRSKIKRDYDKKRGHYLAADAEHLPFEENSFDIVLCSETLEHLPSPKMCMKELFRVSKRYIVITTPIEIRTWWTSIKRKIGVAEDQRTIRPELLSDESFKGHIQKTDLKTLNDWFSNDQWYIIECFITGWHWFEKLKSLEHAKLIDFPFIAKVKRALKKVHRRLPIPLDKPSFIVIALKRIRYVN